MKISAFLVLRAYSKKKEVLKKTVLSNALTVLALLSLSACSSANLSEIKRMLKVKSEASKAKLSGGGIVKNSALSYFEISKRRLFSNGRFVNSF